jgi:hypothetical protein
MAGRTDAGGPTRRGGWGSGATRGLRRKDVERTSRAVQVAGRQRGRRYEANARDGVSRERQVRPA